VEGQKKEEGKPIEIEGVEEWEIEKILNKRKIRGVDKYLVRWKGFMAEHDTWERKEDLENVREVLEKFEGRMNAEVRRQEKLDMAEEKDFRQGELSGKFTAKMLYGWNDGKFEEEYLRKLERNLEGGVMSRTKEVDLIFFIFPFSFYFSFDLFFLFYF